MDYVLNGTGCPKCVEILDRIGFKKGVVVAGAVDRGDADTADAKSDVSRCQVQRAAPRPVPQTRFGRGTRP